eukprot:215885-Amphidinium_carterae.1
MAEKNKTLGGRAPGNSWIEHARAMETHANLVHYIYEAAPSLSQKCSLFVKIGHSFCLLGVLSSRGLARCVNRALVLPSHNGPMAAAHVILRAALGTTT